MASGKSNPDPDALGTTLGTARRAWLDAMEEYKTGPGIVSLPPATALSAEHVARCTLTHSRQAILERMPKGGIVAEVGVLKGNFSQTILDVVQPRELHLFDTNFERHGVRDRFGDELEQGLVRLHQGLSWEQLVDLPDAALDFIYIDADHSYTSVKRDVMVAKEKIVSDGFLIFNDYTYWSPLDCMKYGVVEAVNELCVEEGWEILYFGLQPRLYCDVAIRRMTGDRPSG